jgi:DNA-binding HxlR family transcriptional regulator
MKNTFRCKCPITSALDIIGDKWSLVVIKQMLFEGKSTFKDFVESPEAIATNILTARLKMLEEFGIVKKEKHPTNKKTKIYILTEKGLAFTPMLLELTLWSRDNIQEFNPGLNLDFNLEQVEKDKAKGAQYVIDHYNDFKNQLLSA